MRTTSSASFYGGVPPGAGASLTGGGAVVRVATLHLIDLAGSERVSKSGAAGMQVKESGVINASLLTLGVVINKLISGEPHIPYRDSKLTRLLSTSLGGNACTTVVVNMSPSTWNLGETRSSLQFAARAMKVVNKARVNEVADEAALLAQYRKEVAQLKAALLEGRGGMIITADGEVVSAEEMLARMKRQQDERQRGMEEVLKAQTDATAEAAATLSDALQLMFVASHACGHLRSAPLILEQLAEVAAGRLAPTAAVRALAAGVPGFQKRMPRLLKSQHLRALTDEGVGGSGGSGGAGSVGSGSAASPSLASRRRRRARLPRVPPAWRPGWQPHGGRRAAPAQRGRGSRWRRVRGGQRGAQRAAAAARQL